MSIAVASVSTDFSKPSGLAEGDLMVCVCSDDQYLVASLDSPSGWTDVVHSYTTGQGAKRGEYMVSYKVADAADVAASSFTFTNAEKGVIYRITGAVSSAITVGTGAVLGSESLIILIGISSDNDGDAASFSGYSVTGGASPTFTERLDSYAASNTSLGVADAVYSSTENITGYNVTITPLSGGVDETATDIIKIPAATNASGTAALLSADADFFTTNATASASGTNALLSADADFSAPTAKGTSPSSWSGASKTTTTWTPIND